LHGRDRWRMFKNAINILQDRRLLYEDGAHPGIPSALLRRWRPLLRNWLAELQQSSQNTHFGHRVSELSEACHVNCDHVARYHGAGVAGVPVRIRSPGSRVIVRARSANR